MAALQVDALEENLGFNLYRVALLFRRELMQGLERQGLTPEQWQVLVALETRPEGCTQAELVALTLKDKHALSRTLARMERDGWVRRRTHVSDARANVVVRDSHGPSVRELQKVLTRQFSGVHSLLTRDEYDQLLRLLKKLRAGLETREPA